MVSQLCTLDFTEFLQNCYQAKIWIKFYGFLHSGPIFYMVRLYVMTKMNEQMPERMITSTICHDEPKVLFELGEL